ncbi:MAG: hypothetical protein JXX14_24200 [Deltaproteobacteria bacterium]|nr:hypothetical protein [Deltaproteobacteria bacterium]
MTTKEQHPAIAAIALVFCIVIGLTACNQKPPMTPAETALRLLALHGLLGKTPKERTEKDKNTLVDRDELASFFVDLDKYDQFTGELFTGVILGALAANQSKLQETRRKTTAEVSAGSATIYFELVDNIWKISLEKTIPREMKDRAKAEKQRYEAAKAAGEAAAGPR